MSIEINKIGMKIKSMKHRICSSKNIGKSLAKLPKTERYFKFWKPT